MNQSTRHEVKSLMSEAYKAAKDVKGGEAVAVLTGEARRVMRGAAGMEPEWYAKRQAHALAMVEGAMAVMAFQPAVLNPLGKAAVLLKATEPEEAEVVMAGAEGLTAEPMTEAEPF